ncbi:uncharacterized protein LOC127246707 isoform X1 [Andrographis paniculata]|uniref:uncharacterized protein LOC127246707 isoform X1 n=1 Tax=Andrographis paniculata TaxID=175694 RepID=UPI0021E8161C|nr:uncharacterized protein LOC127246707 isoform X1 [Andrographis paniculata]
MHAKTDSEATSFAPSSPDRNRRPIYFVQSPSRHSHDGEKMGTSYMSTPAPSSPEESPQLYQTYGVNHSRESSTSRRSSKVSPNDVGLPGGGYIRGGLQNWKEFDLVGEDEEGLLEDSEESRKGTSLRCFFLSFVVGFVLLFSVFALILWGVSKPQKPKIAMRSIKFDRVTVQAGSDDTGVSTDMISINATAVFSFQNTANFFGVHVAAAPLTLSYSQLRIGAGAMEEFYQRRSGGRNVTVVVTGDKIPMYGNGAHLMKRNGVTAAPVPLKLELTIRSRAYVLGNLVKTRFEQRIECLIAFDSRKFNVTIPLSKSCTYL